MHRKPPSTLAEINQVEQLFPRVMRSPRAPWGARRVATERSNRGTESRPSAHRLKRRSFSVRSVPCAAAGVPPHSHSRHVQAAARRISATCALAIRAKHGDRFRTRVQRNLLVAVKLVETPEMIRLRSVPVVKTHILKHVVEATFDFVKRGSMSI